jgi:hypothetical protein
VDGHETSFNWLTPLGTVWLVQVVPPSVVVATTPTPASKTVVPTATQSDVDAQETPLKLPTPLGAISLVQVVPPSVDVAM